MNNYVIYKAQNLYTDEMYIGATSNSFYQRKLDHIQKATKGESNKFYEAVRTYGQEAFIWEQIDTATSIDELALKEKYYILLGNATRDGYNSDIGGGFKKTVYQYNLEGKLVGIYNKLEDAAKAVNANRKSISAACLGKIKICKGFYWSYELIDAYSRPEDKRLKEVGQFDYKDRLMVSFSSIAQASKHTRINKSCIAKCCRGKRKSAGGFYWRFN